MRGAIEFEGENIVGWDEARLSAVRGKGVSMVFQDSLDSLNPVYSVGSQVTELLRVRQGLDRRAARERAVALMRQHMCIALAIALRPRVLIADEPATALDVTVQAGILRLVRQLQRETGMALMFVTHDLAVARLVASDVAVMYAGRIVEQGGLDDIYRRPAHPLHPGAARVAARHRPQLERSAPVAGSPPDKAGTVPGCAFHPRCPIATDRCTTEEPDLRALTADRLSRCHHAEGVLDAAH